MVASPSERSDLKSSPRPSRLARFILVVLVVSAQGCESERSQNPQAAPPEPVADAQQATSAPPPERGEPATCESAGSTLQSVLASAPTMSPDDLISFHSIDDSDAPGPQGLCALPRAVELGLVSTYPRIEEWCEPCIYVLGRLPIDAEHAAYALRVPGTYAPTRVDILVFDSAGRMVDTPLLVADAWGDAGYYYRTRSWLFDASEDGPPRVLRHTCATFTDYETADAEPEVVRDEFELILWADSVFGAPQVVDDVATAELFPGDGEACLPAESA